MYFDDFSLHDTFKIDPVLMNYEDAQDFTYKFDPIPIHYDEEAAKAAGFDAIIVPGVFSFMKVWAKFCEEHSIFGDSLIAGKNTKLEWYAPVYAGDVLSSVAYVIDLTPLSRNRGSVELAIDIYNQKGVKVMRDTTQTVIKGSPNKSSQIDYLDDKVIEETTELVYNNDEQPH